MIPKMPRNYEWPMEGEEKIAVFNRAVFNPKEFVPALETEGHTFEIGIPMVSAMGRLCIGVKIDGDYIHPFYRSTGTCTPESSPEGTWWPFSGMTSEIWFGKFYWDPEAQIWYTHEKRRYKLPKYLKAFCDLLPSLVQAIEQSGE